ncbi:hypothetical protein [Melissococcus sp. OM08-11BH]|uniref:hypothetical protein n=1 Tax=Melissococcus sp. OM08-11BH TaxID=2293110 RepID=UPI000E490EFE|nr:hypothetical protein [Melissococcus sp. OM08-11BH]RGI31873.1 hypothetical protein DXC12_00800 [Melissococcus sp. OM08-11BH]
MAYIHVTNKENAQSIIDNLNISPNGISIDELFESYIDRLLTYLEHGALDKFLKKLDEKQLFETPKYLYLGRGVYFFKVEDYLHAKEYGEKYINGDKEYVKIEVNDSHSVCDLNDFKELKQIREFIERKYIGCYLVKYPRIDKETVKVINVIVELILYQLDLIDSNKFQPFVLGIALDIYREFSGDKNDVYFYKFYSRNAPYGVMKNYDIINELKYFYDEKEVI